MGSSKLPHAASELLKLVAPLKKFTTRIDRRTIDTSRPATEIELFKRGMDDAASSIDGNGWPPATSSSSRKSPKMAR
jgi:hypothetical protein